MFVIEDVDDGVYYAGRSGWVEDLQDSRVYQSFGGADNRRKKIIRERVLVENATKERNHFRIFPVEISKKEKHGRL